MKYAAWSALVLVPVALSLGYVGSSWGPDARLAAAPPPLPVEKYLHEKLPEAPKDEPKIVADNFPCYVCHGNYKKEELAVQHGVDDVGCIDCHGQSFPHRNDEDNITPPDKMYPLDQIDKMCADCHDQHDAPARKVIERWQERCPTKSDPKQIICTDCHGQHRLKSRTVRWDKRTGKLLPRAKEPLAPPKDSLSIRDARPTEM